MEIRRPNQKDKEDFVQMIAEFEAAGEVMHGGARTWEACGENFEKWLVLLEQQEKEDFLQNGHGRFIQFLSFEKGELVGLSALRLEDTDFVLNHVDHVGYATRPSQRGKGYAKKQLELLVQKARKLGHSKLLLVCHKSNQASRQTILSTQATFEKSANDYEYYWIEVTNEQSQTARMEI